uniref:Platelet-activating factor receptor n=3 Tax=Lepisosteus oculatus TaxID=7918 RepID=W5NP24_LEPOC
KENISSGNMSTNLSNPVDSSFRYTLFPIFYSLVFFMGLICNSYVLWVFNKMHQSRGMNEIKIYMINLVVADLLFVAALPLWIVYYHKNGNWIFPEFLCTLSGTMFFINTYCSIAFLAVISFNRYRAVTRPLEAASSDQRKRGIIVSGIIWVLNLCCAGPYLFDTHVHKIDEDYYRCYEGYNKTDYEANKKVATIHFLIIALFFFIFLLVIICNLLIIRTLLSQPVPQQNSRKTGVKQRALWMVCAVLGVFIICFVPHHIIQGPWTLAILNLWTTSQDVKQRLNDAHQITLCLMGLNCLLDPIVYCFATRKFKIHLMMRLKMFKESRKCSRYTSDMGVSMELQPHNHPVEPNETPLA